MKKSVFSDKLIIFFIWIIVSAIFIFTYAKMGSPLIDCGREAYIPEQILKGQVLYKDIFNIYAPAAYLFNALLYKIFSPNLNVLYYAAFINYGILNTFLYLISRFFISKERGFILIFLIVATTGISGNVFNFFFPYSYGMAYGITASVIAIYFLVRGNKASDFYWAALFAGLSAALKYEFILFIVPLVFVSLYRQRSLLKVINIIILYMFFPLLSLLILFCQGINVSDLYKEFLILNSVFSSRAMWYFYNITGITFSISHIWIMLFTSIIFFVSIFLLECKKNWRALLKIVLIFFIAAYAVSFFSYSFFVFIPLSILLLFIFRFKKLGYKAVVLAISIFAISIKVFFFLLFFSYGVYYIGLFFVLMAVVLPISYRKKFIIVLAIFVIYLSSFCFKTIKIKSGIIESSRGRVYAGKAQSIPFMQTYNYLKNNTLKEDKILCLPEEPLMNFLLDRDTDNYLYSLIPMYIEVFGEQNIIDRIEDVKPKYIVVNDWNTNSYYFNYFGKDYALGIMQYINEKYSKVFETNYGLKHVVYRRR